MRRKIFFVLILGSLFSLMSAAYSQEASSSMDLVTDFTYWPENKPVYGQTSTHFAPVSGVYDSLELRSTFSYRYTIPVPFGNNPLVSGNNLKLIGALELTPVSLAIEPYLEFTPVAFLVFSSGMKVGSGWSFIGIKGFANYNDATGKYDSVTPFKDWRLQFWMQGLFQFDLAAILPGDWNHVVTQISYKAMYTKSTGQSDGEPWCWQGSGSLVNGWEYYSSAVLGYQMPLIIQMAALQFEFSGYYSYDAIKPEYQPFEVDFMTVQINPVAIFQFNKQHSLTFMLNFSTRRAFDRAPMNNQSNLDLVFTSSEWFFKRVAFRYTFNF
ncbi:MAG: hypothetical protein K5930_03565 [Treponemataceae bacterium]|nr:hypothetical protein [Treponemataceae bacterium]